MLICYTSILEKVDHAKGAGKAKAPAKKGTGKAKGYGKTARDWWERPSEEEEKEEKEEEQREEEEEEANVPDPEQWPWEVGPGLKKRVAVSC